MENLTLRHLIWITDDNLKLSRLRAANVVMLMLLEGCALRYRLRIAWNRDTSQPKWHTRTTDACVYMVNVSTDVLHRGNNIFEMVLSKGV